VTQDDDESVSTRTLDLGGNLPSGRSSRQHVYAVVLVGQKTGAVYRIGQGKTSLGRSSSCDIELPDQGVSREHAHLVHRGLRRVTIEDLGSKNGVIVGGKKVKSQSLEDGDRFQIGSTLLKIYYGDDVEESMQRQLYESSVRDGLTGLYDRRHLEERLEAEFSFAVRHALPLSFLVLDLDGLQAINDAHGRHVGDDVLRDVAEALQNTTRAEDLVARFFGEEFAVLARQTSAVQAMHLAERIRSVVRGLRIQSKSDLRVSVSGGVACFHPTTPFPNADALVEAAFDALKRAKESGPNSIALFDSAGTDRGVAT
jgi:diguanylate cyclase (GGDEF)-like protein